ncbi:hypothetical protein B0A48_16648 [Cryoendolithus antarcticus]|uniref:BZIP domain-containing protein n=1 Tax=Cryoendolithus antarcticus TaxID=1507870 RepID=A0A1V8SEC1_9PEZI|nr:hypothetical protein B0A48_16648 [Cryoendolithus antarcticus]
MLNLQEFSNPTSNYADWPELQLDFSDFLTPELSQDVFSSTSDCSLEADPNSLFVGFDYDFDLSATLNSAPATGGHETLASVPSGPLNELWPASLISTPDYTLLDSSTVRLDSAHSNTTLKTREFTWAPINTGSGSLPTAPTTTTSSTPHRSPDMHSTHPSTVSNLPSPSSSKSPEPPTGETRKRKRERNTEAARRYRQRRQDRLEELEELLADMTKERDEGRIKLARAEAEVDVLRRLVSK